MSCITNDACKTLRLENYSIYDYLAWCGFPKNLEFDGEDKKNYLNDLEEIIIHNDICLRGFYVI